MGERSSSGLRSFVPVAGKRVLAVLVCLLLTLLSAPSALASSATREEPSSGAAACKEQAGGKGRRFGGFHCRGKKDRNGPCNKPCKAGKDAAYVTDFEAPAYPFNAVVFQGLWAREVYEGAHGGQLWVCADGGAAVEVAIEVPRNGGKLSLYSARYWQCGYCRYALVNNATGKVVQSGTVNLYYDNYDSYRPDWEFEVFKAAGLKKGAYTLRVENLGLPGTDQWPREILDYFESQGIEPPPLPTMVNVDCLVLKV